MTSSGIKSVINFSTDAFYPKGGDRKICFKKWYVVVLLLMFVDV